MATIHDTAYPRLASCLGLDLVDNFLLTTREGFVTGPWLKKGDATVKAGGLIEAFAIQPKDVRILARQLSGGNLQKMVLAREFYRRPRLIVAEQPTQGLDIAATEDALNLTLKKAGKKPKKKNYKKLTQGIKSFSKMLRDPSS